MATSAIIAAIMLATVPFADRVNEIRHDLGVNKIEFKADAKLAEYAATCDPLKKEGYWIMLSAGTSSCGKNTFANRADMLYAVSEQYDWMGLDLFDDGLKSFSAALAACPNDKIFIVLETK
jgi:hypothetical protein